MFCALVSVGSSKSIQRICKYLGLSIIQQIH
uniref:Uncharacterized protein n=1 Tax=Lepeophtheirus salmonis TaxID=72036 RepID=A0A0K2VKV4_LEPSM